MNREHEPGNHEDWDYENAIVLPGRKKRTSIFSVRFPTPELNAARRAARALGISTSEFIQEAVAEKVAREGEASRHAAESRADLGHT